MKLELSTVWPHILPTKHVGGEGIIAYERTSYPSNMKKLDPLQHYGPFSSNDLD